MDIIGFKWVADALGQWLDRFSGRQAKKEVAVDEAIRAFLAALQETRFFLSGDAGGERPSQNRQLSDLWLEAARRVRTLDSNLADRCQSKARFWVDPGSWSPKDRKEANIRIASLERTARRLLTNGE